MANNGHTVQNGCITISYGRLMSTISNKGFAIAANVENLHSLGSNSFLTHYPVSYLY